MSDDQKPTKSPFLREWLASLIFTLIVALVGGFIGWAVAVDHSELFEAWRFTAYIPIGAIAGVVVGWGLVGALYWWLKHQFGGIGGCGGY